MSIPGDVKFAFAYTSPLADVVLVDHRCRLRMIFTRSASLAIDSGQSMVLRDSSAIDATAMIGYEYFQEHQEIVTVGLWNSFLMLYSVNMGENGIVFENGIFLDVPTTPTSVYLGIAYS